MKDHRPVDSHKMNMVENNCKDIEKAPQFKIFMAVHIIINTKFLL